MITDLVELKEAFIAKFGDEGLKVWECLDHKISYANYLLGYTNSPNELFNDYNCDDYDDYDDVEGWLVNLDDEFSDEIDECDYSSMHEEKHPMEEMTHFMVSTVEFKDDNDTLFGYVKLVDDVIEIMNVVNYGDRNKRYSSDYHKEIMIDERDNSLRDSGIGFYFERVISFKTDKGDTVYQSFYKIIK